MYYFTFPMDTDTTTKPLMLLDQINAINLKTFVISVKDVYEISLVSES